MDDQTFIRSHEVVVAAERFPTDPPWLDPAKPTGTIRCDGRDEQYWLPPGVKPATVLGAHETKDD